MGLDMYLLAKRYSWADQEDKTVTEAIEKAYGLPKGCEVHTVEVEIGYWRKSNQIHKWFVDNIQSEKDDCGTYPVTKFDLELLKATCIKVLENRELASKLLPTAAGFFFGSTEYEEHYFDTIKDTIEILDKALLLPEQWNISYSSSW